MRSFKDRTGREWNVQVDVTAAKRLRTLLGFNLVASDFGATLEKLLSDPVLICDVVYVLCKPQADEAKVTDEDFGRAMAGDAIEAATEVLLAELTDFTPNPRDRERVRDAIQGLKQMSELARDLAGEALRKALAEASAPPTSGPISGGSQAA